MSADGWEHATAFSTLTTMADNGLVPVVIVSGDDAHYVGFVITEEMAPALANPSQKLRGVFYAALSKNAQLIIEAASMESD